MKVQVFATPKIGRGFAGFSKFLTHAIMAEGWIGEVKFARWWMKEAEEEKYEMKYEKEMEKGE